MHAREARSAQLIRKLGKKDASHVQTLDLVLPATAAERVGRAFGVIAVEAKERVGAALAAHVEDAFARACEDAVRALPPDAPHDQVFEATIGGLNKALLRLFGEHGLALESQMVTSAIVACRDADIVVAVWGTPSALLFHPTNTDVRILDLTSDETERDQQPFRGTSALPCYGSVIAGRIGPHDRLLLSTHDLRAYAEDAQVAAAVLATDPIAASAALDRLLPTGDGVVVASLVMDATPYRYLEDAAVAPRPPRRTSFSVGPTAGSPAPKPAPAAQPAAPTPTATATSPTAPELHAEPSVPVSQHPRRSPFQAFKPLLAFLRVCIVATYRIGRAAFDRDARTKMVSDVDRAIATAIGRFNALPRLSKAMLMTALVMAVLAQGSVAVSALAKAREDAAAAYDRKLEDIARVIDSAEASMIYRDEKRAHELLAEAVTAIGTLPTETEEEIAKKSELDGRIVAARASMRREIVLPEPQTVATIAGDGGPIASMVFDGTSLWTRTQDGTMLRISPTGDATDTVGKADTDAILAPAATGGALALGSAGTVTHFAKTTKESPIDLGDETLTAAASYGGRLYVLDAAHNRIMRHAVADKGYGPGQHYLKDGTDLTGAVSMAIDNSVWVLKENGSIVRVMQGKQEPFTASVADPAVTAALAIRTPSEADDIFVLDSSPSRILRFDKKTGSFMAQYVSPKLEGATDLAIEPGGKNAYVSTGGTVLKFPLQSK